MECIVDNSLCPPQIPIKCDNNAWLNTEWTEPKYHSLSFST